MKTFTWKTSALSTYILYKEAEITWQASAIGFPNFLYEPTILFQCIPISNAVS